MERGWQELDVAAVGICRMRCRTGPRRLTAGRNHLLHTNTHLLVGGEILSAHRVAKPQSAVFVELHIEPEHFAVQAQTATGARLGREFRSRAAPSLTRAEHHGCLVPQMPPALRDAVVLGVVAGLALTAVAGRAVGSQYTPVTAERLLNPEPCNGRGWTLGRGPG